MNGFDRLALRGPIGEYKLYDSGDGLNTWIQTAGAVPFTALVYIDNNRVYPHKLTLPVDILYLAAQKNASAWCLLSSLNKEMYQKCKPLQEAKKDVFAVEVHVEDEDEDSTFSETYFRLPNGWKHGKYISEFIDDDTEEVNIGTYRSGKKEGKWKIENQGADETTKGQYVNGKKEGLWKTFRGDRLIVQDPYRNDRLHGEFLIYDDAGNIVQRKTYKNGRIFNS